MSKASKNLFAAGNDELIFAEEDDDELIFDEEDDAQEEEIASSWKILIVDDEVEIHNITKLALRDFKFEANRSSLLALIPAKNQKI